MARRKQNQFDDDDGRVICNMDVDGMVWHDQRIRRAEREEKVKKIPERERMTKSETRRFTWNAMLAGLVVALIFSGVWVLFTLFATKIWFR